MLLIAAILLTLLGPLFLWMAVDTFAGLRYELDQYPTTRGTISSMYTVDGVRSDNYYIVMEEQSKDLEIARDAYRKLEKMELPIKGIKAWYEAPGKNAKFLHPVQITRGDEMIYSFAQWGRLQWWFAITTLFFGIWTPWYGRKKVLEAWRKEKEDAAFKKVYDMYNK